MASGALIHGARIERGKWIVKPRALDLATAAMSAAGQQEDI
jgi:hypothetical protein